MKASACAILLLLVQLGLVKNRGYSESVGVALSISNNSSLFLQAPASETIGAPSANTSESSLSAAITNYRAEQFDLINRREFSQLLTEAMNGSVDAEYEVGARYMEGEGVKRDSQRASKWLVKAAERENSRAERRLGELLATEVESKSKIKNGLELLNKAAMQGDAQAQVDLGVDYLKGTMTGRDDTKAFQWFMAAAKQGVAQAQRSVGVMYLQGQGTTTNFSAANEWLEKASAQNEPEALFDSGLLYFQGNGVPRDTQRALSYVLKSVIRGFEEGLVFIGLDYMTGNDVPKNINMARQLWQEAARTGNPEAQDDFGKTFLINDDTPPDYRKANYWISRSAAQGFAPGETDLGILFQEGWGGQKDGAEALKWFFLADAQGSQEAHDRKEELLLFLNASQIKEIKQQADAFKPEAEYLTSTDDLEKITCPLDHDFHLAVTIFGVTNQLLVDTGSAFTCLDKKHEVQLGKAIAQDAIVNVFSSNVETAVYCCPEIYAGKQQLRLDWTGLGDFSKIGLVTGESFDGVLGMDFLKNHVICLDSNKDAFLICDSIPDWVKQNAHAIPLKKTTDGINTFSIDAEINGMGTVHLLVDSGSEGLIDLSERDWQQIFTGKSKHVTKKYIGGFGSQMKQTKMTTSKSLILGPNRYSNISTYMIPGANSHSSLGREFIQRYVLGMDFKNQLLYLRQN